MKMKKWMIVAATMSLATAMVQANVINVNFAGNKGTAGQILNGTSASMPASYAGTTWNDSQTSPTALIDVLDTEGNATTVDIAATATGGYGTSVIGLDALKEYRYFNGSISSVGLTITLSGLGANAQWDVYLLSQGNVDNRATRFALGAGSIAANSGIAQGDNSNPLVQDAACTDYTAATWTQNDNYVKFSATADGSGNLVIEAARLYTSASNTGTLNGIQLVAVPEPATLGLIGMVSVGLIVVRRFRM